MICVLNHNISTVRDRPTRDRCMGCDTKTTSFYVKKKKKKSLPLPPRLTRWRSEANCWVRTAKFTYALTILH